MPNGDREAYCYRSVLEKPEPDGEFCPIGNPINPSTGIKQQTETDYSGSGGNRLRWTRTYRSDRNGWSHVYQVSGIDFTNPPTEAMWPEGACLRDIGSITGQSACFKYAASGLANDFAVMRGNGRMLNFGTASTLDPAADINDRVVKTGPGWNVYNASDDTIEFFDLTGRLQTITDRDGQVQTLTYSDSGTPVSIAKKSGLLIRVTDSFGRQLNLTYDSANRLATMTDPGGGVYNYLYDESSSVVLPGKLAPGNLTSVTYPDGTKRIYWYNEQDKTANTNLPFALTGITDENGVRFATYAYNSAGNAISTEHAGSVEKYTVDYTQPNSIASVTDPLHTARSYNFATVLGVAKTTGSSQPGGSGCGPASSAITYDANGNVASRTDFNGNLTTYTYDLARNLETSRIEAAGKPEARTISTQWHGYWRLPVTVAEPKKLSTYVYNGDIDNGNVLTCAPAGALVPVITGGSMQIGVLCKKIEQATSDANGGQGLGATVTGTPRIWTYTYNAYGQVLTADGPRTDATDVATSTYYDAADPDFGKRGKLASVTDALGHATQISAYDANGRPLTLVDPNGLVTTLAYDARGRLTSRSVGTELTSYQYDGVGQPIRITLPDSSYLDYTYDAAHRLTAIADGLGNQIKYTLDAMGNRVREDVLDPNNQLAQTRSRIYDALNRLSKDIGAQNQTTQYAYDGQGNLTSITDPLNHVTTNAYDALNRLKQVTDPGTGVTKYGYDGRDQLTQVTDPRNLVTGYTVDGLGNLSQQSSPDTGTSLNTYDEAGNLLTRTDAKGQVTSYVYDVLNRVTSISFHDGSNQDYAYDQGTNGIGRLTQITETNPAGQVTNQIAYAYDQNGRVLTETRTVAGIAYTSTYSYDNAGRMTGTTYPSGRTVAYSYDALGRIAGMTTTKDGDVKTVVSNVAYQPFGGVRSYTYGNGQTTTRQYDQDGRIAAYSLGAKQYTLGYDAASRIGAIAEYGNAANSNSYGYDALDRLTQAVLPASSYGYAYDAVGNRVTKSAGAGTDVYAYGATNNRLSVITPATGAPRSFQFDANGSTLNDGVRQYGYDTRGRLIQATTGQATANYQLNALGQRVQKSAPGTSGPVNMMFHYDVRGRLIAESDASGTVKLEYVYLNDIPVAVLK